MVHGEKKIEKHSMGSGAQVSVKPVRFCALHGWVAEFQWHSHINCPIREKAEGLELPKTMARAA